MPNRLPAAQSRIVYNPASRAMPPPPPTLDGLEPVLGEIWKPLRLPFGRSIWAAGEKPAAK